MAESPIALECRLTRSCATATGPLASNYIIGEILLVHVRADVLDEQGLPDAARIDFIGRLGARLLHPRPPASLFELKRPEAPGKP